MCCVGRVLVSRLYIWLSSRSCFPVWDDPACCVARILLPACGGALLGTRIVSVTIQGASRVRSLGHISNGNPRETPPGLHQEPGLTAQRGTGSKPILRSSSPQVHQ